MVSWGQRVKEHGRPAGARRGASPLAPHYAPSFSRHAPLYGLLSLTACWGIVAISWASAPRVWLLGWGLALSLGAAGLRERRRSHQRGLSLGGARWAMRRASWRWTLPLGLSWGLGAGFLPWLGSGQQAMLMAILGAVVLASLARFAAFPQAARVFALGAILPAFAYFLWSGSAPLVQLMTAAGIFIFAMEIALRGMSATLTHALGVRDKARAAASQLRLALAAAREEAASARHVKSNVLANMSHDLRTPLNAILGYSEVLAHPLESGGYGAKVCEYASAIHEAGNLLLTIVTDILDHAHAQTGRLEVVETRFDAGEVLRAAIAIARARASEAPGLVILDAPEPPVELMGDERLLKQALINLIANAVKASPAGQAVRVSVARAGEDGCQIDIVDRGPGIAPERMARIFEPFNAADPQIAHRFGGAGLGLPLAKRFIEAHGGRLTLDSAPGKGTRACIHLPAARVARARHAGAA
ncbi:MAG: sensor histidine kinase [Pseudomonadota bacterium]